MPEKAQTSNHVYEGTISKTSPYGFQLEEISDQDKWLNYGKFYEGSKDWKEGDKVKVDIQERNTGDKTYFNIKEITHLNGSVKSIEGTIGAESEFPDRQILIVRQSSWDRAIAYANGNKMKDLDHIREVAHFIEKDIFRPEKFKDDIPF
ncbi:hypothetical protein CMI37_32920 [Candidatus Pacearchaeota archaeon]|nr:hypothetical protein [Candidatus Pacearchaeota archaeon]|tara:strand:- start:1397 stop:1843 length:447 start_codon:yes stop_codon:yes gene_type:complete